MSQHGEQRIHEIYAAALTKPPGERASYVARVAGPDTELRERVEALLSGQQDTVLPGYEPGSAGGEQLLSAGTQIGSYRIEGPLGAGGMGVVYLATDTKLNRPAAIKVLPQNLADPEARRRFQQEAQLVSSLNHPHIVTVYDAGEYEGRQYLITEYVDGGTLRQWAQRPRGWRAIVELLVGVADGIAVAHEAGILHRDIKPENILLAKNGYAKLADFGIAKLLESDPLAEDSAPQRGSEHSTHLGTVAYMSPEQLQGLALDARSDVYSFGLVVQELLAGRRAEGADPTAPRTLPPLPADVPAELRTIVTKALEPDADDRYQSMRDLVVDLRRIVRQSGIETVRASPPWRRPLIYLGAFVVVLVVGFVARDYVRDALTPTSRAVAVLQFVNESGNADDASISERLGDKLREQLQESPDLAVVGRVSSVSFRGVQVDMPTIAKTLAVGTLINGSLRRRGKTLEVDVDILDDRGFTLKALHFERPETTLFALQQEIAGQVREYFFPQLAATAPKPKTPTAQSEQAFALITAGMYLDNAVKDDISIDEEQLAKAIDYYRRAAAADPNSIEAYSRLAAALLYHSDVKGAGVALSRALELGQTLGANAKSADLSYAHYTAALYLILTRSDGADEQYQRALEFNSNNVDALGSYAQWLFTHQSALDADAYFRKAIQLDRQSLKRYVDYAEYLGTVDGVDRLREVAHEVEQRFPADARGYLKLARIYELTGDLDVAIAYGLMAYRLLTSQGAAPNQNAASQKQLVEDAHGQLMEHYAKIGDFDEASKFEPKPGIGQLFLSRRYRELVDLGQDTMIERPDDLDSQYYLAFAYNALGDPALAERTLRNLGFPMPLERTLGGHEGQAVVYYIDALQSLGGNDALVERLVTEVSSEAGSSVLLLKSWWRNTERACALVLVNRVPEAIADIDRIFDAHGLPSLPLLQDSPCFKRLAKEPRYIALIEHLQDRQRLLRERLPATLVKYGVADVRP